MSLLLLQDGTSDVLLQDGTSKLVEQDTSTTPAASPAPENRLVRRNSLLRR